MNRKERSVSGAEPRDGDMTLHRFHGGLVLPGHRETAAVPIRQVAVPRRLVLPLQQHIGAAAQPLVTPGERVLKGQLIAAVRGNVSAAVHASSSGTVSAVEKRPFPHPSGLDAPAIVIETDGRDAWLEPEHGLANYHEIEPARLVEHIRNSGIVGLGGAGFPTQIKLGSSVYHSIELLVINAAECEPYITCDNRLMQEHAAAIVEGVEILRHILQPKHCILATEEHMSAARAALQAAIGETANSSLELVSIPNRYPSGGERQLIRILTGKEVPSQGFPADIGILCQNVGTVAAIRQAVIHGRPLVSRVVTVSGRGIRQPGNLEVPVGTSFREVIETCGGYREPVDRLLMGGPMMGFAVTTDTVPVIKTTNCILAVTREEMPPPPPEQSCIRCGKCTEVCPADLLPQQLYWYSRSDNLDAAQDYHLFDCIECGCCAHVCPSHIPLVQYYRHTKAEIWARESQKKATDIARRRHESRLARLERIRQERAERMARKKQQVSSREDADGDTRQTAIQAALERVRRKKEESGVTPKNTDNLTTEQQQRIREVEERRQRTGRDGEA